MPLAAGCLPMVDVLSRARCLASGHGQRGHGDCMALESLGPEWFPIGRPRLRRSPLQPRPASYSQRLRRNHHQVPSAVSTINPSTNASPYLQL